MLAGYRKAFIHYLSKPNHSKNGTKSQCRPVSAVSVPVSVGCFLIKFLTNVSHLLTVCCEMEEKSCQDEAEGFK